MPNIERVNEELRQELAEAINRSAGVPNVLITVSYAKVSTDLKWADIGISVLPDQYTGSVLRHLTKSAGLLAGIVSKRVRLRQMPRLRFHFDPTEKEAAVMENYIDNLDQEEDGLDFIKVD